MISYWDGQLKNAILSNNLKLVQQSISQVSNINAVYGNFTPLYRASELGHFPIAHLLTQHGADVNAESCSGLTPLHIASGKGHIAIAFLLLGHDANIGAKDGKGLSPLHHASRNTKVEMVRFLIRHGAEVDVRDADNLTPLYIVVKSFCTSIFRTISLNNVIDVARLLIQNRADVNVTDGSGMTPLHIASAKGIVEIVRLLIENGADLDVVSNANKTPWNLACDNGQDGKLAEVFGMGYRRQTQSTGPNQRIWLNPSNEFFLFEQQDHPLAQVTDRQIFNSTLDEFFDHPLAQVSIRGRQTRAQANIPIPVPGQQIGQQIGQEIGQQISQGPKLAHLKSSESSSKPECSICTENEANHALIPCGHVFCLDCVNKIQQKSFNCPNCRKPIRSKLKLFF